MDTQQLLDKENHPQTTPETTAGQENPILSSSEKSEMPSSENSPSEPNACATEEKPPADAEEDGMADVEKAFGLTPDADVQEHEKIEEAATLSKTEAPSKDTRPSVGEADADRFETVLGKDDSWKKVKRPPKWSISKALLMTGVLVGIPWLVYGNLPDIAYFFSGSQPKDLGDASDYIRMNNGKPAKAQDFDDNTLVKMSGFPVRQIAIKTKDGGITHKTKLIYQLMGSGVYVEEPLENSKYAQFLSSTKTQFSLDAGVMAVNVEGRLRRFDTADAKQYAPVREYYTSQYGVTFCNSLTENEKTRARAQLGKGGLALQVMPDKSVLEGSTETTSTIRKIIPLKGRSAVAITNDNDRLTTKDAGRTWTKAHIASDTPISALAYAPNNGSIVYARRKGLTGPENYKPDVPLMVLSQDVEDLIFNAPENMVIEPGLSDLASIPAIVSVGREGLIQLAWNDREGWLPASLIQPPSYRDITRIDNTVYIVGTNGTLMERTLAPNTTWRYAVSPENADWYSIQNIGDTLVAVGSNGKVIRRSPKTSAAWETWPFDDVPGIDFNGTLRASAISGDGKQWVAVGNSGAIVTAHAQEDGTFGRFSAITQTFAGYGFVDDLAAGMSPAAAIAQMMDRHTKENLYDVTWHKGKFYAVGDNGLLMTSPNGHDWSQKTILRSDKRLNAIRFINDTQGFIGGEGGTLLTTTDAGETWHAMKSPTQRSIYRLITLPTLKDVFIFTGAYGLWGYCYAQDARCFIRSKNLPDHYQSLTLATDPKYANKMQLVAVGDNGVINGIDDTIGPDATRSLAATRPAVPLDMAFAESPIPLKPGNASGQLALIASTAGRVFRSSDAGYTFFQTPTGLADDITQVLLSEDGDIAYAVSRSGEVARALHGFRKWQTIELPHQAKAISATLVGKTGFFADRQCLYALESAADAEPKTIACFEDDGITRLNTISRTEIIIESTSGNLYHFSTASDTEIGRIPEAPKIAARESATPSDDAPKLEAQENTPPSEAGTSETPAAPAQPQNTWSKIVSCNGTLWYAQDHALYRLQEDTWKASIVSSNTPLDVVCDQDSVVSVTFSVLRPGLWRLEANKITDIGAEQIWNTAVGFDPSHARIARTKDGFWFISAPSPMDPNYPLILLSKDGKTWSWRSERTTDFMAVAQGTGATVAVGADATIMVSHDMGKNWRDVKTNSKRTLRDVCVSQDGTFGIAVGDGGIIYYTKKSIDYWSRSNYEMTTDLTSCTIDETDGRFNVYIAGKEGLFYVATDRALSKLSLITSPSFENIESLATLQTGEVIAVGGNYQSPNTICEDGFIIIDGQKPFDKWLTVLISFLLVLFWGYTFRTLTLAFAHRNDIDPDELDTSSAS